MQKLQAAGFHFKCFFSWFDWSVFYTWIILNHFFFFSILTFFVLLCFGEYFKKIGAFLSVFAAKLTASQLVPWCMKGFVFPYLKQTFADIKQKINLDLRQNYGNWTVTCLWDGNTQSSLHHSPCPRVIVSVYKCDFNLKYVFTNNKLFIKIVLKKLFCQVHPFLLLLVLHCFRKINKNNTCWVNAELAFTLLLFFSECFGDKL